jgi:hypothetical protein
MREIEWFLAMIVPATGTGYMPAYSQYGMVNAQSARRQMSCSRALPFSPDLPDEPEPLQTL